MKNTKSVISALIFVLALALVVLASPPTSKEDYLRRVTSATDRVSQLISALGDDNLAPGQREEIAKIYRELSELLPPKETIDINGIAVEVDNRWFGQSLAQTQTEANVAAKLQILGGINSRLKELILALDKTASERQFSKDEQKQRLAEILRRPEFRKPQEREPNVGEQFIKWFIDWLERIFPSPSPGAQPFSIGRLPDFVRTLIIALLVIAGGYLIYRIVKALLPEKLENDSEASSIKIILGEQIAEGRDAESLFREAEQIANAGDVRGAIRKTYIGLLLGLGSRRTISLAKYKTNRDYLRELKRAPALFGPAEEVTQRFENVWYGERSVAISDWEEFRDCCRTILGF